MIIMSLKEKTTSVLCPLCYTGQYSDEGWVDCPSCQQKFHTDHLRIFLNNREHLCPICNEAMDLDFTDYSGNYKKRSNFFRRWMISRKAKSG